MFLMVTEAHVQIGSSKEPHANYNSIPAQENFVSGGCILFLS